jgi:hypothetical protein
MSIEPQSSDEASGPLIVAVLFGTILLVVILFWGLIGAGALRFLPSLSSVSLPAVGGILGTIESLINGSTTAIEVIQAQRNNLWLVAVGAVMIWYAVRKAGDVTGDDEELSRFWLVVGTLGSLAVGFVVATDPLETLSRLASLWWVLVALVLAYLGWTFISAREERSSSGSAVRATRRQLDEVAEEAGETATGLIVIAFSTAATLAAAVLGGLDQFGDILVRIAGEVAYLVTIGLGYLGFGGSLPGGWIVPDLTPAQFAAIALIIGGLAIAIRR